MKVRRLTASVLYAVAALALVVSMVACQRTLAPEPSPTAMQTATTAPTLPPPSTTTAVVAPAATPRPPTRPTEVVPGSPVATRVPAVKPSSMIIGMRAFNDQSIQDFGDRADLLSVRLGDSGTVKSEQLKSLLTEIPQPRRALWIATTDGLDALLSSLPPVSYVEYDLERWDQTSQWDQDHPVESVQRAEQIVHAHGAKLLITPTSYFNDNFGDQLARYTDIYVPQAKAYQASMTSDQYKQTVGNLLNRLRAANPNVKLLLDISPQAKGIGKSSQELLQAVDLVRSVAPIDGVWITYRPNEEKTVTDFLRLLASHDGVAA